MWNRWAPLALAATLACSDGAEPSYPVPPTTPTGETVAEVGPVTLTSDEIEARFRQQNPMFQARIRQEGQLEKFVEAEVKGEILAQEAFDRGIFDRPEVQRALRQAAVTSMMQEQLEQIDAELEVTEDEVVAEYQKRYDEFNRPETARVAALSLEVKGKRARAAQKRAFEEAAERVRKGQKAGDMNAFDEEARKFTGEHGIDRTEVDLGFVTQKELSEKIGEAGAKRIFEDMTVGDVAVVESEDAVHLVRKTGRRRPVERSLENMRRSLEGQIKARRRQEKVDEWIREIAEKRGVQMELQNLDSIDVGQKAQSSEAGGAG